MLKTGLDRASTIGKLGYWTSRASEIRRQRRLLGGKLSTPPALIVASMFVNKTKTTLRAHTVDKNTSSVCGSKRRFRPKPHAPVLFLSIYRDTVPLRVYEQVVFLSRLHNRQVWSRPRIPPFPPPTLPKAEVLPLKLHIVQKVRNIEL